MFLITVVLSTIVLTDGLRDGYFAHNTSRTVAGVAEYRSALTMDWFTAENTRQRGLVMAFDTESSIRASDCINYPRPSSGKVAKLIIELLRNLEGDDGTIIDELIKALMRSNLLVETSMMEAEPTLEALVETPGVMRGEPHATFPRVLALAWMAATDPDSVKKYGWCPVRRIAKYLKVTKPAQIANHMREVDSVVARARFVLEDFIQRVTPNVYDKKKLYRTSPMHVLPLASRTSENGRRQILKEDIPYYTYTNQNFSSRTEISTLALDVNYSQYKHILVTNPMIEDLKTNNGYKLFCNWVINLVTICHLFTL